ncbi:TIGR01906 family membrane protein [Mycoplasmatota bacterium zrk1]
MKILSKITLSVFLSIVFILIAFQMVSTKQYMMVSYNQYERHQEITWDYEFAVTNIMDYLNGKQDNLVFGSSPIMSDVLMTERGLAHMEDVKVLYERGKILIAFSIVMVAVSAIYLWDRKEFWSTLKRIWVFPTVFVGSITLLMIVNFDFAFTMFHKTLFTNDLWMLRYDDPLLVMLPINFFFVTAIIVVLITVLLHVLTIILACKKSHL